MKPYSKENGEWWDEVPKAARKLYRRMFRRLLKTRLLRELRANGLK